MHNIKVNLVIYALNKIHQGIIILRHNALSTAMSVTFCKLSERNYYNSVFSRDIDLYIYDI